MSKIPAPMAAWRNRQLAGGTLQRFAAKFFLVRPFARRNARRLFDICSGFVYTQTLTSCLETGLLRELASASLSKEELRTRCGLGARGIDALITAAQALGLIEAEGRDRWRLATLGAATLGDPGIVSMIEHNQLLYRDLLQANAWFRDEADPGELQAYWAYVSSNGALSPEDVSRYSQLMAASSRLVIDELLAALPIPRSGLWMDVAGGEGRLLEALHKASPGLALRLVELGPVAERARDRLACVGVPAEIVPRGFDAEPLPAGADVISLLRVLHDHSDATVRTLLCSVRNALAPGGQLVIAEPMAGVKGAERVGAYFSVYLLAMGSGRPRTSREITAMLRDAGFSRIRFHRVRQPLMTQVVTAS